MESLAEKVGSALVSGSSEPLNQIQAYDEEKIGKCSFSAVTAPAAADSVPAAVPAPAPAPAGLPVEMPAPAAAAPAAAQIDAGDLAPAPVRAGASSQHAH